MFLQQPRSYVRGASILKLTGGTAFLLHHGGVLTYKGSAPPSRVYFLAGTSEEPFQPSLQWLYVWNGFAWVALTSFQMPSLKFPEVDNLTEANGGYKKFGFPKMCGGEGGRSTVPIQVKISYLRMIKIVLSLIYAHLLWCLVSHNKQSDFHFDKDNLKIYFYIGLNRIVTEKVCHISKSMIKTYRN